MNEARIIGNGSLCAVRRDARPRRMPTTQGFAALHDHARLPWRFFGRFTASIAAGLSRA